jgi:hypothetical protein
MSVQVQLRRDANANILSRFGAVGEVWIDTTLNRLVVNDGATAGGFSPCTTLSVQNNGDTNNSSSAFGSDHDHTPTFTIPANFMTSGRAFRVTAHMQLATGSAAPTLAHKMKLGSTVMSGMAAVTPANSLSNVQFMLQWIFQATQAPGASANVQCVEMATSNFGAAVSNFNTMAMPVAIATNAAVVVKVATVWGSAGTGTNTIALNQLIVEALN